MLINKELRSSTGERTKRDIVQFVDYNKHKNNYANLVKETLREIPKQCIQYMEDNSILPLDHEQKNQNKLKFKDLAAMKEQEEFAEKEESAFFQNLKENFIKDCMNLGFDEEAVNNLANNGVMSLDINFAFEFLTTQKKVENQKKRKDKKKNYNHHYEYRL